MENDEDNQSQGDNKHSDIQKRPNIDTEEIEELRERLYSRNSGVVRSTRHKLPQREQPRKVSSVPDTKNLAENSKEIERSEVKQTKHEPVAAPQPKESEVIYSEDMAKVNRRSSYRKIITIVGVLFFVIAVSVSSFFMFFGNNTISGNNIAIKISGPISIGGGEELPFQVSIANQNEVPIQAATLIIEYPRGTKSASEKDKELITERVQLESIDSGELVNIPLKAVIYGEEHDEQEIDVRVEYRVEGSNATFEKRATPLSFKISTSPIVLTFDSVKQISSGQEIELVLTVQSNSPTPLSNILVKASYPIGFDFTESSPDTVSGEDTWNFEVLKPSEKQTITIKGLVIGGENEVRTFDASAGVASDRDQNILVSQLANARTEVTVEQPFLDVVVSINDSSEETVVINEDDNALVFISFVNTLETALYDGKIFVELGGNAINEFNVSAVGGFYDSNSNTITWDGTSNAELKEILPGKVVRLSSTLDPKSNVGRAPELTLKIAFSGERQVFSSEVPQELEGIVSRIIKVESVPEIESEVLYGSGPFTNTGPVPPVAEQITQYTYEINVEGGVNDVTDAEITAVLPLYVSWLDLVQGDGTVTYNATTRTMKWNIGDMDSDEKKTMFAQVSALPSLTQIGSTPTLLGSQRFKATDRFTGTVVRVDHRALTTALFNESDENLEDGRVRQSE